MFLWGRGIWAVGERRTIRREPIPPLVKCVGEKGMVEEGGQPIGRADPTLGEEPLRRVTDPPPHSPDPTRGSVLRTGTDSDRARARPHTLSHTEATNECRQTQAHWH